MHIVDDTRSALLSTTHQAPPQFPEATGSFHDIAGHGIARDEVDECADLSFRHDAASGSLKHDRFHNGYRDRPHVPAVAEADLSVNDRLAERSRLTRTTARSRFLP